MFEVPKIQFFLLDKVLLKSGLRTFFCRESCNVAITAFLSRMSQLRAFLSRMSWLRAWQKFSEILRILPEILSKKLAGGASAVGR